jgi:hypothetical protein
VRRRATTALALATCSALLLAACGGGDEESTTRTTTAPPPERETRDPLPDRPEDWKRFVNERGGYALLLPRGWEPDRDGSRTLVRSFDRLVALSIVPDRAAESLETPIAEYARNTAAGLRGFEDGLEVKETRPHAHRYDAVEVFGTGTSRDGVDQRVSVIVLRREQLATITAVLAANAKPAAKESVRIAERVIDTIRTRPPPGGAG